MTLREIFFSLGYEVDKSSEKKAEDSINKLKSTATKLLGAIGIGFSLANLNAIAEEFNGINDQIKYATKGLGDQDEIQQQILAAANDTRVSYSQMADVVSDLVQKDKSLFGSVDEATEFAALTTKLFKSAGKSESEIASLQETINKSFAKGIVDSSTLNSLLEKAPEAINLMSESLGVTKDELISMAAAGTLSASTLKTAFTSSADAINAEFNDLDFNISDALLNIRNKWGLWVDDMNSTLKLTQTIGNAMVKGFSKVMDVLGRVKTRLEWVSEKLGGTDKLLKLLAITAGALFVAFNLDKIVSGIKAIGSAIGGVNKKALAIAAVIILIALLIEDFVKFMSGEDSLIGELFKKAGIDADEVRDKIRAAWTNIKTFLTNTWNKIKSIATEIWGGLKNFWAKHGDSVKLSLLSVWKAIKTVLTASWNAIKAIAVTVFGALKRFWDTWGSTIKDKFETTFSFLIDTIQGLADFVTGVFSGDWSGAWESIKSVFGGALDYITEMLGGLAPIFAAVTAAVLAYKAVTIASSIATKAKTVAEVTGAVASKAAAAAQWLLNAALSANPIGIVIALIAALVAAFIMLWRNNEEFREFFINLWNTIKDFFIGIWTSISEFLSGVWDGIKDTVGSIKDTIVEGLTKAVDWIKALPAKAIEWGKDIIQGIIDGIKAKVSGVVDAVKGIGSTIKDFLGFSEPEEGPLSDFHTYMPDMIDLMAKGIAAGKSKVVNALKGITGEMSVAASANIVSSGTLAKAGSDSVKTSNITQNVAINNQFNGDQAGQKKSSAAMDKASSDATSEMARALAFGK